MNISGGSTFSVSRKSGQCRSGILADSCEIPIIPHCSDTSVNPNSYGVYREGGFVKDMLTCIILFLLGILAFWLFAIAPQMHNRPDMRTWEKYDYAHRGLHNWEAGLPENSLPAFAKAVEGGFGVELDVRLTADNKIVVIHDSHLWRLCGVDNYVEKMTLKDLRSLKLQHSQERIPTLEEALSVIGETTPVMVELKVENNNYELLCALTWSVMSSRPGQYSIQSFNPLAVRWFKEHQPSVIRGQLMQGTLPNNEIGQFQAFLGRNLFSNMFTRPNFESYNYQDRARASLWMAKNVLGMPEVSWTITDSETYASLKKKGCIIIFEGFHPLAQSPQPDSTQPSMETSPASMCSQLKIHNTGKR